MKNPYLYLPLIAGMFLTSCASTLMLREHHRELTRLASGTLSPEETFEGLSSVLVEVFEDVQSFNNPDQRVHFIRKFAKQNDEEIRIILRNLQEWQQSLRPIEKGRMVLSLARQPATKELIRMLPDLLQMVNDNEQQLSRMRKLLLMYRLRQWINQGGSND